VGIDICITYDHHHLRVCLHCSVQEQIAESVWAALVLVAVMVALAAL
jgi:hypothetical protein